MHMVASRHGCQSAMVGTGGPLIAVKAGSVFLGRICTSVRTPLRAHLSLSNYLTA